MLQGAVGTQLCGLDVMLMDGFVVGVSFLLVSEELFWVRDFYHINYIQGKLRGEEDGAAGTERKVLSIVWEMKVARRGACVNGTLSSLGASTGWFCKSYCCLICYVHNMMLL